MRITYQSLPESGAAHLTELSLSLDRLKQEHDELMQVLVELENKAKQVEQEDDTDTAIRLLLHLRLWTHAFKEELERHSNWEEKELFPFLNRYFRRQSAPSIIASFWTMEKDHELAADYLQSFLRAVHMARRDTEIERLHQTALYLIHACRILKEHLEKEERLIFPMTEEVLTDMDYLFS
ncbi:hemerythrin domain-containing protein [Paenibacillus hamazuiensis]|uniref:hemerythrin domain-containing protein n=1 Tax=Paenibacillus hamazuiensis TaxID=2936508 RepID=UPI00200D09C5|nr:hemerythrin domain-containing protein [Paenibacillus hamazuiensis]